MFNQWRRKLVALWANERFDPEKRDNNMKQGQSTKRPRGHRGNGRRPSGGRNSNFESSGPQGKIRGTAYQVIEKYQALGRDALTFGDRVAAENYFQHAEHYYRVMVANGGAEQRGARQPAQPQNRPQQTPEQTPEQNPEQEAAAQPSPAPEAARSEQTELIAEESPAAAVEPEQNVAGEDSAPKTAEAEAPTA